MAKKAQSAEDFAKALKKRTASKYVLRLYVAGISKRSSKAIKTITAICDEHLKNRYTLEIIDIYKNPTLAKGQQIIAAPTLIKVLPAPLRKLIGDMADKDKVLLGLDLRPVDNETNDQHQQILA